jgi:hypothetical protein
MAGHECAAVDRTLELEVAGIEDNAPHDDRCGRP